MQRLALIAMLLLLLAACDSGDDNGGDGPTPTTAPFTSAISIVYPRPETVVYAETLAVSGSKAEGPTQTFRLELRQEGGSVIAATTVEADSTEWQVELVHGYTGEPVSATLHALPSDDTEGSYDMVELLIADQSHRPEGVFGTISTPQDGGTIGGDMLLVAGTVSGVFENTFTVQLLREDDSVIDAVNVTVFNPYFVDEVPWEAELTIEEYTGPAQIRVFYVDAASGDEITLDSVAVMVGAAAG